MIPPFSDVDLRALKTMTGELISAVGTSKEAASILPTAQGTVAEPHVSAWASPHTLDRFMPIHHVARLEIRAQQPIVSNWMVGRLARDGSARLGEMRTADVLRLMRQTAMLNGVVSAAFQDDRADSAERAEIREEIAATRRLLDEIERMVAQP